MIRGKTAAEALALKSGDLAGELGPLPLLAYARYAQGGAGADGRESSGPPPTLTYAPNVACWEGQDRFTYQTSDGLFTSARATVTIDLGAPTPNCQDVMVEENTGANQAVSIPLGAYDPCGRCDNVMTFHVTPAPAPNATVGTLGVLTQPDSTYPTQGLVLYTPPANYMGPDQFQFAAGYGDNISFPAATAYVEVVPA